jgi:acetoin utilization deacetylase AcuC-like enzyme
MRSPLVYSPRYNTSLSQFGIDKPFALDRGQSVLERLSEEFGEDFPYELPAPVELDDVLLVHTERYLKSLSDPNVWIEIMEFKGAEYRPEEATRPLNELIDDILLKCGGTLLAAEIALEQGLSANLGGGYHHAFPDCGRGFCVLHDIAIAARSLQKRNLCKSIMIVDLDFHQGDGTALVFSGDPSVYTLSVHSEEGWPEEKQRSDLDVSIRSDETHLYLEKAKQSLLKALDEFEPELCIYVAGSDPYELDVLPGTSFIKLDLEQMRARDEFVIDTFADRKIPLTSVFAGGYGPDVWHVHYWATRHMLVRAGALPNVPAGHST